MLSEFLSKFSDLLMQGMLDTLVMLFASTAIAYVIGIALGVVLNLTAPDGLRPMPAFNAVLGWVVNIGRSLPFIILLIAPPRRSWARRRVSVASSRRSSWRRRRSSRAWWSSRLPR